MEDYRLNNRKIFKQAEEPADAKAGDLWAQEPNPDKCPYPIGETKVQYTANDNPNVLYPGTVWTDITNTIVSSGCRYPAFSPVAVGTKYDQELPNIKGRIGRWLNNVVWSGWTDGAFSGGIKQLTSLEMKPDAQVGSNAYTYGGEFNASLSNSIYKDAGKVQPYTYTIKLWQRTA